MKTYILFKPETTSRCLMIVVRFLRAAYPDVHFKTHADIRLSPGDVLALYSDDMPEPVKQESVKRLSGRQLTVIQVSDGAEAVEHIAAIRGSNIDPSLCELKTLRKMLYDELGCEPVVLEGGYRYYPNFVHIPQDRREALVCEGLFGKYFND